MTTTALRILPLAGRSPVPASPPDPRLSRGGPGCRALTTADMLAEIGEAPAPISAAQALAFLSAAVDRAAALEIAA